MKNMFTGLLTPRSPASPCHVCAEPGSPSGGLILCPRCTPKATTLTRIAPGVYSGRWPGGVLPRLDAPPTATEALLLLEAECPRGASAKAHEDGALKHGYWDGAKGRMSCTVDEMFFQVNNWGTIWDASDAQKAYDAACEAEKASKEAAAAELICRACCASGASKDAFCVCGTKNWIETPRRRLAPVETVPVTFRKAQEVHAAFLAAWPEMRDYFSVIKQIAEDGRAETPPGTRDRAGEYCVSCTLEGRPRCVCAPKAVANVAAETT